MTTEERHDGLHEHAFLREHYAQIDHKIARRHEALQAAHTPVEERSLGLMLHAAEQERALILEIMAAQASSDPPLSLEAIVLQQLDCLRHARAQVMAGWKRGHRTPAAYWELETRQAALTTLLGDFRVWMNHGAALPDYQTHETATCPQKAHLGPWIPTQATNEVPTLSADAAPRAMGVGQAEPLIALEAAIYAALDRAGCPEGLVEIVVESPEMVMVRGSAHSHEERDLILTTVMSVEAVQEVLADVYVLRPGQKPAMLFDRRHTNTPTANPPGMNGRSANGYGTPE